MRGLHLGVAVALSAMAAVAVSGGAAAAGTYASQDNTTVNVSAPVSAPNLGTGALSMSLQEQVQGVVQGALGTDLPYDFVIVEVNGSPVLGVDPFCDYSG